MKINKIIKTLLPLTTIGVTILPTLSSCDSKSDKARKIDGSDWEGVYSGKFVEDNYEVDETTKTVVYTNGLNICASNLVIPNYVSYNGQAYRVMLGGLCFFQNKNLLYSVELNNFIVDIPHDCFNGCERITKIIFQKYPKSFDYLAFYKASNLREICVKSNGFELKDWTKEVSSFGESCFEETKISGEINCGYELQHIGAKAFYKCDNITNVNLSFANQLVKIDPYAFFGCRQIKYVFLPESLEKIDDSAFSGCEALVKIIGPKNYIDIALGDYSVSYCYSFVGFENIGLTSCGKACFSYDPLIQMPYWNIESKLNVIDVATFYGTGYTTLSIFPFAKGGPYDIYSLAFAGCEQLHIIDVSYFEQLPTWTGEFIFQSVPKYGTIYVSRSVWNGGDVDQKWYDYFSHLGLNMASKEDDDPSIPAWRFEY